VQLALQLAPIASRIDGDKCFFKKLGATDRRSSRPTDALATPRAVSQNSGENEANFFARLKFVETQFAESNSLKNENEFADQNVSHGQMRDQIVAIRAVFC
jgi:hypothetical protein